MRIPYSEVRKKELTSLREGPVWAKAEYLAIGITMNVDK